LREGGKKNAKEREEISEFFCKAACRAAFKGQIGGARLTA
jgi:hypothetical protein